MNLRRQRRQLGVAATGLLCLGATLGATSAAWTDGAAAATAHGLSLAGCAPGALPSGFTLDATHSGSITPAQYSASGDIQASLIYDQYKRGLRDVYTDLTASTATTASTSSTGADVVIECVGMRFSSAENANRFYQSYNYQRSLAHTVAQKIALPKRIGSSSVAYREEQQSFSGYHIASTDVIEAAMQQGDYFYSVSVAGPTPQVKTAFGLLKRIAP
jgi:hypothetical protein